MTSAIKRLAAIDIGSNTVHMVTMDVSRKGPPVHRDSQSVILKLGAVVSVQNRLPTAVYRKLKRTLAYFVKRARKDKIDHIVIGATQAMRALPKSANVLARLTRAIGIPITLLSGKREAELGFLGVRSELHSRQCQLIIDSGGASTELTLVNGTRIIETVSIPLGAAVLSTQLQRDPPSAFEVARLMIPIIQALRAAPVQALPISALLTGGTAHHLLSVANADPARLNRADLEKALKRLLKKPSRKIARKYAMEEDRAKLLVPGGLLLTALLDHYALDHLRITSRGLRDGMAIAYLKNKQTWSV